MSKFFDETQKAQRSPKPGTAASVDVENLVDVIKREGYLPLESKERSRSTGRQIKIGNQPATGLADGLTQNNYYSSSASEAYRTLRTRVMRLQSIRRMRSMMITSSMPGEGKTVTSLNLALSCAQLHDRRIL